MYLNSIFKFYTHSTIWYFPVEDEDSHHRIISILYLISFLKKVNAISVDFNGQNFCYFCPAKLCKYKRRKNFLMAFFFDIKMICHFNMFKTERNASIHKNITAECQCADVIKKNITLAIDVTDILKWSNWILNALHQ